MLCCPGGSTFKSEDGASSSSSSSSSPSVLRHVLSLFLCVIRAHAYATRRDITCGVVRTGPSDRHGRTTESGADGVSVSLEAALPKHDHGASQRRPARRSQPVAGALRTAPRSLSSVLRRRAASPCALPCRFFFMRLFARGVVFMSEWRKNEKRIDPGALNGKHTGFALKCELSNEKMQKTAAPRLCLAFPHPAAHGLLSLVSLLGAFLLNVIKRNQVKAQG